MIGAREIAAFLHFGYVPRPPLPARVAALAADTARATGDLAEMAEADLVRRGVAILPSLYDVAATDDQVVPLSGGLDSRAILGGLLDRGLKGRVLAVTFGTPGTYDYEIGRLVAEHAGVTHEAIDLSRCELTPETLIGSARAVGRPVWLFGYHFLRLVLARRGQDATYWSGYLGDPLAGSHLLATDSPTWAEAVRVFAERSRFARSFRLTPPGFRVESLLPERPPLDSSTLSLDEQLDFLVRQESLIRPTVTVADYPFRTPFDQHQWVSFITHVPRRFREGQGLYRRILRQAYPSLFALPTKGSLGLRHDSPAWRRTWRRWSVRSAAGVRRLLPGVRCGIDPRLNYVDWDAALRRRPDYVNLMRECLADLRRRGCVDWLDLDRIWRQHSHCQANHGAALTLLASLELHFRAGEEGQGS